MIKSIILFIRILGQDHEQNNELFVQEEFFSRVK